MAGSFLSRITCLSRSSSPSVVSFAETAFSASVTCWLALALLISGSTFCAANRNFGSSSAIHPLATMLGSVVNTSPAWMLPFFSALIVSGPPASSDLNSLNTTLYFALSPGAPVCRVFHSGGPPRVSWPATGCRSAIDLRLYLSAVSLVTVTESLSSAVDWSRTVSFAGTLVFSAANTSSEVTWVAFLSKYCRSTPLYSGIRSIEPSCRPGM